MSAPIADAAASFLQTVVIVDDFAYRDIDQGAGDVATLGSESLEDDGQEPDEATYEEGPVDAQDLHTEAIVEGFADLGVNCAVLAPGAENRELDERRVKLLAARSDVVILDWIIRPTSPETVASTQGQTSLSMLIDILRLDMEAGGRLRLVCIYSGKQNIAEIVIAVKDALASNFEIAFSESDGLRIDIGSARIVFLSKERDVPTPGTSTVKAEDLPMRVLDEFRQFAASGLLPEIAMQSLSAVRGQAHRLLRRFSRDLDPALVSHRSVTSPTHAVELSLALVGDELSAIVEAEVTTRVLSDAQITEYVEKAFEGRVDALYWKPGKLEPSPPLSSDLARTALTAGVDDDDRICGTDARFDRKISRVSLLIPGGKDVVRTRATQVELGFSALSLLSRDSAFDGRQNPRPILQVGTVLRLPSLAASASAEGFRADDFLICLQPLCDSVRLMAPTKFPMLQLQEGDHQKHDYVISRDGSFITLKALSTRLRDISLPVFNPSAERQAVIADWSDDEGWFFSDTGGTRYLWHGNLRFAIAHKLLNSVAQAAGRIGINEYEHLRRAAGR